MSRSAESSIVTKCALVMDILSRARQPMAFSELVERTGFVKSSCHRILAVLQSENLIDYDKIGRTYRTGPRLHDWARSAWRRIDLQQAASEVMVELGERAGMNVALSVLDIDTILYLRTINIVPVRYAGHSGDHAPLHCTAAGKVFLAHMTGTRLQTTLGSLRLDRMTERTRLSVAELSAELPDIRSRGFAFVQGEEFLHVTGIATPIWDAQDQVTACLSLWAITVDTGPDPVIARAGDLIGAARQISEKLGWQEGANALN